jgi:hypothetical protein
MDTKDTHARDILSSLIIDILVNLDGEYCQVKYSMFGEKENKKLKALDVKYKL